VAKRRIRLALLDFAMRNGLVRGEHPDWYRVAELFAEMAMPELLENSAMTRGPGRPKNEDDFLAVEIHRVMSVFDTGVKEACRRIARGDKVPLRTGVVQKSGKRKPAMTAGSPWQSTEVQPIKAGTLERRYWRWLRAEKQRQKKSAVKIR
jgi:hypothetical protein